MIKFSITVPVYNVEIYLKDCIESILKQSFDDYEILLIDDGSTDRSGLICDEYASLYSRITVIHKGNGGLSDARNVGIKNAKGEYLVFIDSDDYIDIDSLEKFDEQIEKSNQPDLLITQMKKIYEESNTIKYMDHKMSTELVRSDLKEEIIKYMFTKSNNLWPSVRYIVKRSFVEENDIKFQVGYMHEDLDWTSKIFLFANSFSVSDIYWYNHRMSRKGSITSTKNSKRTLDIIALVSSNINDCRYNDISPVIKNIMFQRMVRSLFSSLSNYKYYSDEEKRKIIDSLNHNKFVFKYAVVFRHKLFIAFSKIFSYNMCFRLMALLQKNK